MSKNSFDAERKRRYDKLAEFGLVRYDTKSDLTRSSCDGSGEIAWLSDVGKATKAYFNRIVLEQISFLPSDAK